MTDAESLMKLCAHLAREDYPDGAFVEVNVVRTESKNFDNQTFRVCEEPLRFSIGAARRALVRSLTPAPAPGQEAA